MILTPESYKVDCGCGKQHKVLLEQAVIEKGALLQMDALREKLGLGGAAAAVYDENTWQATQSRRPGAKWQIVLPAANLHADEHGVAALEEKLPAGCEVLIAVGSGTVHDITRYVAAQHDLPFISAPTAASVDGFVSTVAAMTWHGFKVTMPAVSPRLLVADTDVFAKAPMRLTRAGVGDVIGKYVSLADWKLGHLLTGEYYCDGIAGLTRAAVEKVKTSYTGLNGGEEDAYESLMYALVFSGVAMQLAGNSRPASAAEHHVSHLLELGVPWLGRNEELHGEKVGVGTVLCARRYHQFAAMALPQWQALRPVEKLAAYHSPTMQELQPWFGQLAGEVQKENEGDCLLAVPAPAVEEKWDEMREVLRGVPQAEEVEALLKALGAKHSLAGIGVDEAKEEDLLRWSPYVRNRLTFMRVLHSVAKAQ